MDVSVTQYAEAYGITRQAVIKRIHEKKLPKGQKAKKVGHAWVIKVKKSDLEPCGVEATAARR